MNKHPIFNGQGRVVSTTPNLKKQAFGLMGSIYEYPNTQRFRPRWYTNQDNELGASSLTRDLVLRWSRELTQQLPWIQAGIRTMAMFAVGDAYKPIYKGSNSAWGKQATDWLINEFYPNCNKRGSTFDFTTSMFVASLMLDQDGDMLCIYGEDAEGNPKFQIVPSHRITSMGSKSAHDVVIPTPNAIASPQAGPLPNTILSDGVIYNKEGAPVGYNVVNPDNMVNSMLGNQSNLFFSSRDSQLIFDPRFFDRGRGFPSITSGILQALSLQEIESYMVEKLKIESMIALVEKTPDGEGPQDEANSMASMLADDSMLGGEPGGCLNNASKGLRVVNNPGIKYVNATGGDVKSLSSSTPANETQEYITRLETHVLQTIGIPHMLLFSPEKLSGRASDGIAKVFNAAVSYRQKILDKWANFIISWAAAKAIKNGDLPPNDEENLHTVFEVSHPPIFSLNDGYDRSSDLKDYAAGLKNLTEVLHKRDKTVAEFMKEVEAEKTAFFEVAQRISKSTGTDIKLVINSMKEDLGMQNMPLAAVDNSAN